MNPSHRVVDTGGIRWVVDELRRPVSYIGTDNVETPVSGGAILTSRLIAAAARAAATGNPLESAVMSSPPTVTTPGTAPGGYYGIGPWDTNGKGAFKVRGLTGPAFELQVGSYYRVRGARISTSYTQVGATSGFVVEFATEAPYVYVDITGTAANEICFAVGNPDMTNMRMQSFAGTVRGSANASIGIDWSGVRQARGYRFYFWADQGIGQVRVDPMSQVWAPVYDSPRICDIGDSFIAATLSPSGNGALFGLPNAMREESGCDIVGQGIGGSGYIVGNVLSNAYRIEDAASANADLYRVWLGGNDVGQSGIQAAVTNTLTLLRAALPGKKIQVFGPNPGTANLSANLLACEAEISAAVAALADPLTRFVPVNVASSTTSIEASGNGRTIFFTGALTAATSATLSAVWLGPTGTYTIMFSDGTTKSVTLTNNNTAVSWTGAVTATATAIAYTAAGNAAYITGPDGTHLVSTGYGSRYMARRRHAASIADCLAAGW